MTAQPVFCLTVANAVRLFIQILIKIIHHDNLFQRKMHFNKINIIIVLHHFMGFFCFLARCLYVSLLRSLSMDTEGIANHLLNSFTLEVYRMKFPWSIFLTWLNVLPNLPNPLNLFCILFNFNYFFFILIKLHLVFLKLFLVSNVNIRNSDKNRQICQARQTVLNNP